MILVFAGDCQHSPNSGLPQKRICLFYIWHHFLVFFFFWWPAKLCYLFGRGFFFFCSNHYIESSRLQSVRPWNKIVNPKRYNVRDENEKIIISQKYFEILNNTLYMRTKKTSTIITEHKTNKKTHHHIFIYFIISRERTNSSVIFCFFFFCFLLFF